MWLAASSQALEEERLTAVTPMQRTQLHFVANFHVALSNPRGQVAEMTIAPGDAEGGPGNRHIGADQWLFVQSGMGIATVSGKQTRLRRGMVLLIERGEEHEIRNTGRAPLRTLNFYTPPAYDSDAEPLARGRASG
jgi:mannose-6-phosphate isomerase-like protein (cupin superfamily)